MHQSLVSEGGRKVPTGRPVLGHDLRHKENIEPHLTYTTAVPAVLTFQSHDTNPKREIRPGQRLLVHPLLTPTI